MKRSLPFITVLAAAIAVSALGIHMADGGAPQLQEKLVSADSKDIQYTGRFDFSDPKLPKCWASGCYVQAKFHGPGCDAIINDQVLYGTSHNYIEVVVDHRSPVRVQTTGPVNRIPVARGLADGIHTVTLCKDTEAGIGYIQFAGFQCKGLAPMPPKPKRKLEFIGDSITCGTSSDLMDVPCGKGQWYDQHNAYLSYGPVTARRLHAQWHITAVSGIGLVHSCCGMTQTMPDVFDKTALNVGSERWNFRQYQPDCVTICLGQNDGTQDPMTFRDTYAAFIHKIRIVYPQAQIVCLTSPMGDANLTTMMKANLTDVVDRVRAGGDSKVSAFFFSRQFHSGCGGHPDVAEHQLIADELSNSLKTTLVW